MNIKSHTAVNAKPWNRPSDCSSPFFVTSRMNRYWLPLAEVILPSRCGMPNAERRGYWQGRREEKHLHQVAVGSALAALRHLT